MVYINSVPSHPSWFLWAGKSVRAQWGWLASAPQCLGPQLEGSKAGGQNRLKTSSLTSGACCWLSAETLAGLMAGHPHVRPL